MIAIRSALLALVLFGSAGPGMAQPVAPPQATVQVADLPPDQDFGPTRPGPTDPAGPLR